MVSYVDAVVAVIVMCVLCLWCMCVWRENVMGRG